MYELTVHYTIQDYELTIQDYYEIINPRTNDTLWNLGEKPQRKR